MLALCAIPVQPRAGTCQQVKHQLFVDHTTIRGLLGAMLLVEPAR